jgi:hypothetical protein
MSNSYFVYDHYSDQPHVIKDKAYKRAMRKKHLGSLVKTFVITLLLLPWLIIRSFLPQRQQHNTQTLFGLGVNLDKFPEQTPALVKELGVRELLIRIPIDDTKNIVNYTDFITSMSNVIVTVNLIQTREMVEEHETLAQNIHTIFQALSPYVKRYQVANAINRAKWGFFSVEEYLNFFMVVQRVRDHHFRDLKLIGSSVIDFEYHYTLHTLFNGFNLRYDGVASLLYVDRRGAPENKQMIFDLLGKINLLRSIVNLSPKTNNDIFITETNWPITGTTPYAPTSETECVDVQSYANYMVRYYLITLISGQVTTVYWHQLISAGYGLIDQRGETLKKYPAFGAFKFMVKMVQDQHLLDYSVGDGYYFLGFETFEIHWSLIEEKRVFEKETTVYDIYGTAMQKEEVMITESPLYIMKEK